MRYGMRGDEGPRGRIPRWDPYPPSLVMAMEPLGSIRKFGPKMMAEVITRCSRDGVLPKQDTEAHG